MAIRAPIGMLNESPEKISSGPKDFDKFEAVSSGMGELYGIKYRLFSEPGMTRKTNFTLSSENARRDIIMSQLTG